MGQIWPKSGPVLAQDRVPWRTGVPEFPTAMKLSLAQSHKIVGGSLGFSFFFVLKVGGERLLWISEGQQLDGRPCSRWLSTHT